MTTQLPHDRENDNLFVSCFCVLPVRPPSSFGVSQTISMNYDMIFANLVSHGYSALRRDIKILPMRLLVL